ncbi:uncharacterized protein K452DRAFT_84821 [Aplosporella prunicola CBS 121167]|uniref:Uncharacterized protein n=1 Tax=Aplosporella prunicola CBS 121167 TaxID=1176127 RepID=A0A6A6B3M6_9PEZI|nr:uncharacterized protein K452DRAFT_84821 [Aplosporella prunicola CBS 121167]KAF2138809.1 hypothetical protein K452DRAFT_84821 [Aplosporella prunicola CBS 121167]
MARLLSQKQKAGGWQVSREAQPQRQEPPRVSISAQRKEEVEGKEEEEEETTKGMRDDDGYVQQQSSTVLRRKYVECKQQTCTRQRKSRYLTCPSATAGPHQAAPSPQPQKQRPHRDGPSRTPPHTRTRTAMDHMGATYALQPTLTYLGWICIVALRSIRIRLRPKSRPQKLTPAHDPPCAPHSLLSLTFARKRVVCHRGGTEAGKKICFLALLFDGAGAGAGGRAFHLHRCLRGQRHQLHHTVPRLVCLGM